MAVPGWLAWILDNIHYVWPVLLAFYLARREIARRRKHAEELEAKLAAKAEPVEEDDEQGRTPPV